MHPTEPPRATQLHSNILSPLTDPSIIDGRLDAVRPYPSRILCPGERALTVSPCRSRSSSTRRSALAQSAKRSRSASIRLSPSSFTTDALRACARRLKALDLDKIVSRLLSPIRTASTSSSSRTSTSSLFPRSTVNQDPSSRIASHLAHLLHLRQFLSSLPKLRAAVEHADARLLRAVDRALADEQLDRIADVIEAGVNPDVWAAQGGDGPGRKGGSAAAAGGLTKRHARLFAIKAERKLPCVACLPLVGPCCL